MTTGAPPHVPIPHDTVDDKSATATRQRSDPHHTAGPSALPRAPDRLSRDLCLIYFATPRCLYIIGPGYTCPTQTPNPPLITSPTVALLVHLIFGTHILTFLIGYCLLWGLRLLESDISFFSSFLYALRLCVHG